MLARTSVSTDETLFDAWLAGDGRAGEQLVVRHNSAVRRYLERQVGPDTEDAVQNVWTAITRCRERFQRRSSFKTYLYAVVRNQAFEERRRRKRNRRYGPIDVETTEAPAPTPLTAITRMEDAKLLAAALADLPKELQRLVMLYYFEHRSAREIGEMFGIPENTARSRIRRAKLLLRQELERMERAKKADSERGEG